MIDLTRLHEKEQKLFRELLRSLTGLELENLALMSRYYGQFTLDQDGLQYYFLNGANTSINLGDIAFAKLSGKCLGDITTQGFGRLHVSQTLRTLGELAPMAREVRASDYKKDFSKADELDRLVEIVLGNNTVESFLHAMMIGSRHMPRFTLHDHCTAKNWLLCSKYSREGFNEIFENDEDVMYLESTEPGIFLAVLVQDQLKTARKTPHILLLEQHGAVQSGDGIKDVYAFDRKVRDTIIGYALPKLPKHPFGVKEYQTPDSNEVVRATAETLEVFKQFYGDHPGYFVEQVNPLVMRMLNSRKALDTARKGNPNPDAIVHGKIASMDVDYHPGCQGIRERIQAALDQYIKSYAWLAPDGKPYIPRTILFPGLCAVSVGLTQKQASNGNFALLDTANVMAGAEAFGGMVPYKFQYYIANWRQEKKRAEMVEK